MKLRRRAVVKWTGAGLCALILAVWFGSGWLSAAGGHTGSGARSVVLVGGGRVELARFLSSDASFFGGTEGWAFEWWYGEKYPGWLWRPEHVSGPSRPLVSGQLVTIPLYLPFVMLAFPTAWLFYLDRRSMQWAEAGRCAKCGYDLSGLTRGAACPECGKRAEE